MYVKSFRRPVFRVLSGWTIGERSVFKNKEKLAQFSPSAISCHEHRFVRPPNNSTGCRFMNVSSRLLHYGKSALLTLALLYSLLAGLRTVTDPDTGWQLASGRYIVQHYQIPSTDVLSYTAHGREWIYPPLAEIVLYGLYALGGFAALSWLNSFGCVATVSCAFYAESSVAAIALAILAVPRIAYRTAPRADMFSTVLFAALLALLWRHFRSRRAPLWLVPVIMLIWVNAHPGFIAGLALLALYVTLEVLEFPFSDRSA